MAIRNEGIASLNYAAPERRIPRTWFLWVLMALSPSLFYSAFTGYCYLRYGHRPVYGAPEYGVFREVLALIALIFLLLSPIAAVLCGLSTKRLASWPRRIAAAVMFPLVLLALNYCLYTVDPFGVTEWMRD